jgi:hypothetical protein
MYEGLWAMKNGNRKVERGAKLGLNTRKPVMRACLHCMLSLHMQVFAFLKIQPRMCGTAGLKQATPVMLRNAEPFVSFYEWVARLENSWSSESDNTFNTVGHP